jgi:TolB-like protein
MKRAMNMVGIMVFFCMACTSSPPPAPLPEGPTLDETIQQAAVSMGVNLKSGIKIAMLNYTSSSIAFSEYVLDELGGALVNTRRVSVVDRRELDIIRREENFQLSGEVSDESQVSIGKKLGAQMVVSGSLRNLGTEYRFTARALNVETAQVEAFFSSDISKGDKRTAYLLSVRNPTPPPPPPPPRPTQPTVANPYRPLSSLQNATVIGTAQTSFTFRNDSYLNHISDLNELSYIKLLETAKRDYKGNIDIADITWVYNGYTRDSDRRILNYNYSATGKVVKLP